MKNIFKLGAVFMALAVVVSSLLIGGAIASAETTVTNLIVNGDFSNGTTGWTFTDASKATVTNGQLVLSGNPSAAFKATASFSSVLGDGKTYTLRFDMSNASDSVCVKVHKSSGSGSGATLKCEAGGTYTFKVEEGLKSDGESSGTRFEIYVSAPRYVENTGIFDNFILVEGDTIPTNMTTTTAGGTSATDAGTSATAGDTTATETATAATSGDTTASTAGTTTTSSSVKNLIVNGDFSNGTTGWTFTDASKATVTDGKLVLSGNPSAAFKATASFDGVLGDGKTYTLRFDMSNASDSVCVKVHKSSGSGSGATLTCTESGTYTFKVEEGLKSDGESSGTRFEIFVSAPRYVENTGTFDNFILVEGDTIPTNVTTETTATTATSATTETTATTATSATGTGTAAIPSETTATAGDTTATETGTVATSGDTTASTAGTSATSSSVKNLIVNGDFSNGTTGWTFTDASKATVTDGKLVLSGNPSAAFKATASFDGVLGDGKTYTLRFDMSGASDSVCVKVHKSSGSGSGATLTCTESGTYTFKVESGLTSEGETSGTRFEIFVSAPRYVENTGTFDNFILVEGDTIPTGMTTQSTAGGTSATDAGTSATAAASTTMAQPVAHAVTVSLGTSLSATAFVGETVTVTADTPASGFVFDKWVGDGITFADETATQTTFTMPDSDVTVEATYKMASYAITVVNGTADKVTATPGSIVSIEATVPAGYVFEKWTGEGVTFADETAAETTFEMLASDVTVTASFILAPTTATGAEPTETSAEPTATETGAEPTATESATGTEATETAATATETEATAAETEATIATEATGIIASTATEWVPGTETIATATATETKAITRVYGDGNGDGDVNMKDVLILRKYLAGFSVSMDMEACDVNRDGDVNMKDVLMLRKYLAGIITELG